MQQPHVLAGQQGQHVADQTGVEGTGRCAAEHDLVVVEKQNLGILRGHRADRSRAASARQTERKTLPEGFSRFARPRMVLLPQKSGRSTLTAPESTSPSSGAEAPAANTTLFLSNRSVRAPRQSSSAGREPESIP